VQESHPQTGVDLTYISQSGDTPGSDTISLYHARQRGRRVSVFSVPSLRRRKHEIRSPKLERNSNFKREAENPNGRSQRAPPRLFLSFPIRALNLFRISSFELRVYQRGSVLDTVASSTATQALTLDSLGNWDLAVDTGIGTTLGTWMEEDPTGYAAGPNVYEAMLGAPIENTDPYGLQAAPAASTSAGGGTPQSGSSAPDDDQHVPVKVKDSVHKGPPPPPDRQRDPNTRPNEMPNGPKTGQLPTVVHPGPPKTWQQRADDDEKQIKALEDRIDDAACSDPVDVAQIANLERQAAALEADAANAQHMADVTNAGRGPNAPPSTSGPIAAPGRGN
jgi:hypothetical protein